MNTAPNFTAEDATKILDTVMHNIWMGNDFDVVDTVFTPDAHIEDFVPDTVLTRSEYRDAVEQLLLMAKVEQYEVIDVIADGHDRAVVFVNIDLRLETTQQIAPLHGIFKLTMRNGQIAINHNYLDIFTYFETLGILPPGAMFVCMSGGKLT